MQDADLFMELAAIAGVFVGFGALIAVRSGGPSEPQEVAPMRAVVSMGVLTVIAALAPVSLGRYDLTEHGVWALSSALVLVGILVMLAAMARTPEYQAAWAAELAAPRSRWWIVGWTPFVLYVAVLLLTPIAIMLGLAPDLEAALYFTVVVSVMLGAAWGLMGLVFMPRRSETA